MIIEGYDTKDLKFIGFFDSCLFKINDDSGGYVYENKNGEKVYFTRKQIKRAIKKKNRRNKNADSN